MTLCDNCHKTITGGLLALRKWPRLHPGLVGKTVKCIDLKFCNIYCLDSFVHSAQGYDLVDKPEEDKET